ncbi:MAG: SHOCT domain-containing protein [Clostridia bacterium]|nr:SHOCT domain-containing protein [Clostridia bacterium]
MERTKNKFYVATSVLEFVFASICVLYSLILIIGMATGTLSETIKTDLLAEYGSATPEMLEALQMVNSMIITMIVFMVGSSAVMYVSGVYFLKYSNLTDQEADEKWGKCLGWTITAYFFGGLLLGGLATAGLCAVQAKQRERVVGGTANWTTSTGKTVNMSTGVVEQEDVLAPENLEKIRVRLEKLKALKDTGAISEEEFESLRAKTMAGLTPKKEEPKVNPEDEKLARMTERLNKLTALKESGAISEEEYASLREKVINETK